MLFLRSRFSSVRSATNSFMSRISRRSPLTSTEVADAPYRPRALLGTPSTSCNIGSRYPLAAAQRGDAFLATQSLQNNADLLFGRILLARLTADIPNRLLGGVFRRHRFLSHLRSPTGLCDEPKSSLTPEASICPKGADVRQSSITPRMRKRRAGPNVSDRKSRLQRCPGPSETASGCLVPVARLRPRRRRTDSPSSR